MPQESKLVEKGLASIFRQNILDLQPEIIVDLFAGGGGTSTGIETVIGVPPHIAVNHNDNALSMHRINHPFTRHFVADVYEVCPITVTQGRPVGGLHLSPDCTDHSQAGGGQPRNENIRSLSWVGKRWAGQVSPRVITLENVKQIQKWGPLVSKRCKDTGRVVKRDGSVAAPGEQVPRGEQYLIPDPARIGRTWRRFKRELEGLGYVVETRVLCAADYGAPTTRERLFMVARRDGNPVVWPEPTHFKNPAKGQKKWRAAAECIDWDIACPSIFSRKKPLAEATLRRIAKGLQRYVLNSADPFIVPIAHYNGRDTAHAIGEPLRTITSATKGGEFAVVVPSIVPATHHGSDRVNDIADPLPTVTVAVKGVPYVIVDIGLRMLQPRELYRAQGFPEDYIIDHGHDGRVFSKSEQVKMCGNSVPPPLAAALFAANLPELAIKRIAA